MQQNLAPQPDIPSSMDNGIQSSRSIRSLKIDGKEYYMAPMPVVDIER